MGHDLVLEQPLQPEVLLKVLKGKKTKPINRYIDAGLGTDAFHEGNEGLNPMATPPDWTCCMNTVQRRSCSVMNRVKR